jgi:hypothetical protein
VRQILSGYSNQAMRGLPFVLDMGHMLARAALGDDASGLALTLAALGGYTKFHLDVIKIQTGTRAPLNRFVIDATAYANNHDALNLQ